MQSTISTDNRPQSGIINWIKTNRGLLIVLVLMILFPFIVALIDGQSPTAVLNNETGNAKFMQGLMIEIFILAVYDISYDLVLGITGLLSFGHAMFFAAGAYMTGIALKNFGWGMGATLWLGGRSGGSQRLKLLWGKTKSLRGGERVGTGSVTQSGVVQ